MYERISYLKSIEPYINKPIIKVITGMRRVGKSCFLLQIKQSLIKKGISEKNIIMITMESLDFDFIKNHKDLNEYIKKLSSKQQGKIYLLIDEVQEIESWEKAIISLFKEEKYDIFITGSNAHLLSSELATLISGRYIQFPIYPLSFKEFTEFGLSSDSIEEQFKIYLKFGGLPGIQHFLEHEKETFQYLESIYDTILLKDIVQRFNIRNVNTLKNIARFIFDNIGNIFSAKKITEYMKNQKINLSVDTVQNYTKFLNDAYLIHKVNRYDIKGKKIMEISEKYYLNDLGIRHAAMGYKEMDIANILENIIYIELLRRGYTVYIGKNDELEVDFIATNQDKKYYIQVSYIIESEKTEEREIKPFNKINDHHPKILLTLDKFYTSSKTDGIKLYNIIDFLLNDYL